MRNEEHTARHSEKELKAMRARGESRTDWKRLDRLTEDDLDQEIATDPDWAEIPHDWHKRAVPFYPKGPKAQITLRLDPDVLAWYKQQGKGYQTRINAVLRAYMDAHRQDEGARLS
jgi:uncharacterized protein (DUF4415 family)